MTDFYDELETAELHGDSPRSVYRTLEDFLDITDSCLNGNWTAAAERYNESAFGVKDFSDFMHDEHCDTFSFEDLACLVELACKIKGESK